MREALGWCPRVRRMPPSWTSVAPPKVPVVHVGVPDGPAGTSLGVSALNNAPAIFMSAIPQPIVHLVVAQHHLPQAQREAEGEKPPA